MRILYVAMAHDYGRPEQGPSFEETNFRSALDGMGHDVVAFDFMQRDREVGRRRMNEELVAAAEEARPDVAFFCLFEREIAPETIERVGRIAPTVNWFADDHWRFEDFTRHYAPSFTWAVTTDEDSLPNYAAIGHRNVILSQWAANRYAYTRTATALEHDVTFVGQPHGDRRQVIGALERAGIHVECWGAGWPNGRIGHEEMVHLFGASRVNLNLANSSLPSPRQRLAALLRGRRARPRPSQIKGRTFEVPGSGGFLLSDRVPHLEKYFELDREMAVFDDAAELPERIGYWLAHPEERAAVAEAGYQRVLREHTYDHRFAAIFATALG
jgi:spore maturation protein CgeB